MDRFNYMETKSLRPVLKYLFSALPSIFMHIFLMHDLPFFNRAFAQELRTLRERSRLTQMRLAIEIGGSEVAVRRMERGAQTPTVTTLILIANALRMTPADLLSKVVERMRALENAEKDNDGVEV